MRFWIKKYSPNFSDIGLINSKESTLGVGTCSSSLLKLAVCWLSAEGLSENLGAPNHQILKKSIINFA